VRALDLYRAVARVPGNVFVSPHGVATALALVAAGARGRTRDELAQLLGATDPVARYEALGRELATRNQHSALEIANALWHQRGYPIEPDFATALASRLGATARDADFAGDTASAVRAINAWAAEATHQRIRDIVDKLPELTRVIVANAIYFKARWAKQFDEHWTRPAAFTTASGARVDVPTMQETGYFRYARAGAAQAIELAYSGGVIAMLIVVPDAGAFADVERALNLDQVAAALAPRMVGLALPKFRVESMFRLREPLRELGLVEAFTGMADFSAISREPGFAFADVLHKTYVDVDEHGTEAAAVTMPLLEGSAPPRDILELRVDRPFLFAIRDVPTGTILFVGRVEDPSSRR
jgi:serpin B